MKYINDWIVQVEPADSLESIADWIGEHALPPAKFTPDYDQWLHLLNAGDIIIFNSPSDQGMYRYPSKVRPRPEIEVLTSVNMLTKGQTRTWLSKLPKFRKG